VKRLLLLGALPLLLVVVWAADSAGGNDVATVDVVAKNPTELRGAVITRMGQLGGTRIGERSSFSGTGSSELNFRMPTARLEEALIALDSLGGTVTDQEIDISDSSDQAESVGRGIDDIQSCLDGLSGAAGDGAAALNERIATCQGTADRVAGQMDGATVDVAQSELQVRISPSDSSNPLLVAAIFVLLLAAVGLTIMVWRSSRLHPELDLRDMGDFPNYDDDAFLRRN
jgi:hypothetical protein